MAADPGTSTPLRRIPKNCTAACVPEPIGAAIEAFQMTAFEDGVAVTSKTEVRVYSGSTAPVRTTAADPGNASGTTRFGDQVARACEGLSPDVAGRGTLYPSKATFLLVTKNLADAADPAPGATTLAADCTGIWAFHYFRTNAVVGRSGPGLQPRAVITRNKAFAMAADSTHVYLAQPDGVGGLGRLAPGERRRSPTWFRPPTPGTSP